MMHKTQPARPSSTVATRLSAVAQPHRSHDFPCRPKPTALLDTPARNSGSCINQPKSDSKASCHSYECQAVQDPKATVCRFGSPCSPIRQPGSVRFKSNLPSSSEEGSRENSKAAALQVSGKASDSFRPCSQIQRLHTLCTGCAQRVNLKPLPALGLSGCQPCAKTK